MNFVPVVQVALLLGGLGLLGLIAANGRTAWRWMPILLAGFVGVAFAYHVLHPAFALESVRVDPPWAAAALLAVYTAVGASGAFRFTSWPTVVLGTALLGDTAVAAGLALAEPDDARRARLVVAASGASLISPWSGATVLTLGHGPWALSALGLGLALFGLAGGGAPKPAFARPDLGAAWRAGLVPLWMALLTWLFMLGAVSDLVGVALEGLPPMVPGHATAWLGTVAAILGAVGYEPGVALFSQDVILHATQVRGEWLADALRVGGSVGAGLPLLLATRSKLTVGLPLWVGQVLVAVGFLFLRYRV